MIDDNDIETIDDKKEEVFEHVRKKNLKIPLWRKVVLRRDFDTIIENFFKRFRRKK
jgi:hypothetical protein